jgi:hypothetical protein
MPSNPEESLAQLLDAIRDGDRGLACIACRELADLLEEGGAMPADPRSRLTVQWNVPRRDTFWVEPVAAALGEPSRYRGLGM